MESTGPKRRFTWSDLPWPSLRRRAMEALRGCTGNLHVDLGSRAFLSSRHLALLIELRCRGLDLGRRIVLELSSPDLQRLLHVVGFTDTFEMRCPPLT